MRVFLTGATGFVGGHLVRELLSRGHRITALVRSPQKVMSLGDEVDRVVGDLHDSEALRRGMTSCDAVVHCAGTLFETRGGQFQRVNVEGTRNVLEAAAASKSIGRFVHVSTIAAAGPARAGSVLDESMPCEPISAYGHSKLRGELLVRAFGEHFETVIVRPPVVYGPGDTATLMLFKLAELGLAPSVARADQLTSVVHVQDLSRGIALALEKKEAVGETFYFAHANAPTTAELMQAAGAAFGKDVRILPVPRLLALCAAHVSKSVARVTQKPPVFNPDKLNEMLAASWGCSSSRAREKLGYRDSCTYSEGLRATARWYDEQGWL